jgi:hypothetical protein
MLGRRGRDPADPPVVKTSELKYSLEPQLQKRPLRDVAVLPFFSFVFFALVERKKDKHMIGEYHAAAGKNASL